jgi:hypothetical protein
VKCQDPVATLKEFAIEYIDAGPDKDWLTVLCPFHNDGEDIRKGHGGINKESGAYNCFSCGHPADIFKFISTKLSVPVSTVHAFNDNIFGTRNTKGGVEPALIAMCHRNLVESPELLQTIFNKHGITIETIRKYELGLYPHTGRVTIPVKDENGRYADLRQYKYGVLGENEPKIISRAKAQTHLFIAGDTNAETIYLTEGEFKALLLNQNGLTAVSSTHGATSWREEFNHQFRGKHVVIIYDIDKAGRLNAEKRCISLFRHAASIKNVLLTEVDDIKGGDITDYIVKKKFTIEDLLKKVDETPVYVPYKMPSTTLDDSPPVAIRLSQASEAIYNGKRITTTCVISAKDTSPYIIPSKVRVNCGRSKDYCTNCRIYDKPDDATFTYDTSSSEILELVSQTEKGRLDTHKKKSGIYAGCKVSTFQTLESMNVEELRVIPQLAVGHASDEQVTRRVFYAGHGINTNAAYNIEARVAPTVDTSHATLIVYKADPAVDNLDDFEPKHDLSVFKPTAWTSDAINTKLKEIYTDFASNVTRIKMREDLHLVYDLVYHSCLYIPYEGRSIKGWADVLVIGDSGQGKSECSSRLMQHYKAGERIDSKRASVAGIVGGLQETNDRWFITWGTIPLNDRRLVILEEVKGMGVGELTKLTDMRSSGFAEIHKIERARTYARTRLIWISNPRSDCKIGAYNYGVDAVRELIGSLEDIRRFDLVAAVASGEVPLGVINSTHMATTEHVYTSDKCSDLVQWAWSRKEHQIVVLPETVEEALRAATRLAETYSSACPIVEPSDQRLKMLRLATACAARTYSTDDGGILIVRPCHVEVVEQLMDRLYKAKALGYYEFSQASKNEEKVLDVANVSDVIKAMPHAKDCSRGMLEAETIRVEDIMNFTDWPIDKCNEMIGVLVRNNCLKRSKRGGFRKTSAFIDQLKSLDRSGELVNKTFKELIQNGTEL